MRRAIASLCVCWLGWCAVEPSNTVPLAYGMTRGQAEAALGVTLQPLTRRRNSGLYYAAGPLVIPGYYATSSVLALQFRRGRLTGWKQDFRLQRPYY